MQVLVAVEYRYRLAPDGYIYGDGPTSYSFWSTFLDTFDKVLILARVAPVRVSGSAEERADGPGVSFAGLPDYRGPWEYIRKLPKLRARSRQAVLESDAFILRVPGLVGRLVWSELRRLRIPYAIDVVGDPWDALGPGTWRSLFRPIFRRVGARDLRVMCEDAAAVHYVTTGALQRRYPPSPLAYTTTFPNLLMDSAFASAQILKERCERLEFGEALRMGFIGTLAQLYKGPDVLLNAAAICRSRGVDFELVIVGDGRRAPDMNALAERLGIENRTRFAGQLAFGQAIRDFLDTVDLFVMPSRQEGLPRAMLEAMARGCPCIGSNIGGIPELLAPEDLVPPNDPKALADKITEVTADPKRMKAMSERNLARAKQFDPETLRVARLKFYQYVRDHSANNGESGSEAQ
jgi:glycosyltransferase involved in cell wall biosynthesis